MDVRRRNVPTSQNFRTNENKQGADQTKKSSNHTYCLFVVFLFLIPSLMIATMPLFTLNLDKPLKPTAVEIPELIPFEGNLKPNHLLEKAKYIGHHKLAGPETIVFVNGTLYTGLLNGQIVRIDKDEKIHKICQIGEESDEKICNNHGLNLHSIPKCGRPLGLRLKPGTNLLYVADSYYGIVKVDLLTGTKQLVLSSNDTRFGDMPMKMTNDLDFDGDVIYIIDSSYERGVNEALEEHLEANPRGRLFAYNEKTNQLEFLVGQLYFPNGLQLMPDKESALINENSMSRIIRCYLKGPSKGTKAVFVDLPGFGDTIRMSDHNTILAPIVSTRYSKWASILDLTGRHPLLRTIMGTIIDIRQLFLSLPKYGLVVEYDLKGHLLKSWHDPSGKVIQSNSNVAVHDKKLYLGSFYIDYIAVVDY